MWERSGIGRAAVRTAARLDGRAIFWRTRQVFVPPHTSPRPSAPNLVVNSDHQIFVPGRAPGTLRRPPRRRHERTRSTAMSGYTRVNLKNDVEDMAPKFGYAPGV